MLQVHHESNCSVVGSVGDPDLDPQEPHVFGFTGSGSGSISQSYGSGSFPFLINVLGGLKECFQNKIVNTKFLQKILFLRLTIQCLWVSYKKKI